MVFRSYRLKKKDNVIIEGQKKEVEQQKNIIEEKQKEILDSIHYAKRIQTALLANKEMLKNNIPDNFVFFRPKDIVSGDFYWATEHNDKFYLAVCDSTGHGVPGAFMSMLGMAYLNEIVVERKITKPNEVLNTLRNEIITSLNQEESKEESRDGMDMASFVLITKI